MWELYNLLGRGQGKRYVLDEIIEMMSNIDPIHIKRSMFLLYRTLPSNPLEYGIMFTRGLNYNKFFEFQAFVETLNGRSK